MEEIGDQRSADLFASHDRRARDLLIPHDGLEIDKTDGFLLVFERPIQAVAYALAYHEALEKLSREAGLVLEARVGIHLGEVYVRENSADDVARGAKPLEVEGLAKPMAARLMSLADGGQTLLTRSAFDLARRAAVGVDSVSKDLEWLAHGDYLIKGVDEPTGIYEVGIQGKAPLEAPADSEKVRRSESGETILGWRPASGQEIARRRHWVLDEKVGEGGFGEVWLARHRKTGDRRVFKFCFDAGRLRSLQREITVFRLLKEELGDREDIARILDWDFDEAPYFIESEYTEGGSLLDWVEEQGGLSEVPLHVRLEIVAQAAEALAAAHSVGVLHRDMKPGNLLIHTNQNGELQVRVCDFGMGVLTDEERLQSAGITVLGMTRGLGQTELATTSGTVLYNAPELTEGKAPTIPADVYALGVVLYQLVVGNLSRALGAGWERGVEDELLREDIAAAIDVNPRRRIASTLELAERLRSLDARLAKREAERRAVASHARTRRRQKVAAVLLVVISIFAIAMTIQSRRVAREAERANSEAEAARRVSDFLIELFEVSDPGEARGNEVTARELLDRGAERIRSELEDQPLIQARLMDTMGAVYEQLGLYRQAAPLLEWALETRQEELGVVHADIAESLTELGVLKWRLAQLSEAEDLFERSLEITEQIFEPDDLEVGRAHGDLGLVLQEQGKYAAAEEEYRRSLEISEKILGPEHRETLNNLNNLASVFVDQGRLTEAVSLFERVAEARERVYGPEDTSLGSAWNNLGATYLELGRSEEAEVSLRRSLRMRQKVLGSQHPFVGTTLSNLGRAYLLTGRHAEAEHHLEDAIQVYEDALGMQHPELAEPLRHYANLRRDQGRFDEAESIYRRSLELREAAFGTDDDDALETWKDFAVLLRETGRSEEADEIDERIASLRDR